ncbi:MAG: 16S rRNA (uracil(1498)-N(3))-methyltransferase [Firmicutes bacterium]|nr:16S rRNA (uracil(1498)-N(3))-methyltransferase [Bacillota bacterium]
MQRYFALQKQDNYFQLRNDDYYHILRVMRGKENDKIEVVYDNCVYLCGLKDVETDLKIEILSQLEVGAKEKEFVLCIPFLKEQKMDFIFQKGTEMGATKFLLIPTKYSIIKIDNKKMKHKLERWSRILKEASEQSKRTEIPEIEVVDTLMELEQLDGVKFVCSTRETKNNLKMFLQSHINCDKLVVVIGPEGGLDNTEEKQLNEMGYESISLGRRIMRVESVPLFVLSCFNYEYME